MNAPSLELDGIGKRFADQAVLDELSLALGPGEILALLGPSGSGKTTALRVVAGFETPDRGRVLVGGEDVTGEPPAKRRFGMVFQHYALFPHLDVGGNVAFGIAHLPADTRARRVAETLALVGLSGLAVRRVDELSGGQQQRVAMARALAPQPRVLLLDEPMSNLDPTLRERTRRELEATLRRTGITTLLVTHEQEEAFALADRVAVLAHGRLQQVAAPRELYAAPANRFVATFVGRAGTLPATLVAGEDGRRLVQLRLGDGGGAFWEVATTDALEQAGTTALGLELAVVARPESLTLVDAEHPRALAAEVTAARFLGVSTLLSLRVGVAGGETTLEVYAPALGAPPRNGSTVHVAPVEDGLRPWAFPADDPSAPPGGEPPA